MVVIRVLKSAAGAPVGGGADPAFGIGSQPL